MPRVLAVFVAVVMSVIAPRMCFAEATPGCSAAWDAVVHSTYDLPLSERERIAQTIRGCEEDDTQGRIGLALALGSMKSHDDETRQLLEPYASRLGSARGLRTLAWIEDERGREDRGDMYRKSCSHLIDLATTSEVVRDPKFCNKRRAELYADQSRLGTVFLGAESAAPIAWRTAAAIVALVLLARRFKKRVDPIGRLRAALPAHIARNVLFVGCVAAWLVGPYTLGAAALGLAIALARWERRKVMQLLVTQGLSGYAARPMRNEDDPHLAIVPSGAHLAEPLVLERVSIPSYREPARVPICVVT